MLKRSDLIGRAAWSVVGPSSAGETQSPVPALPRRATVVFPWVVTQPASISNNDFVSEAAEQAA
jgi:hypothetical protein